jgi:hypothetical protein
MIAAAVLIFLLTHQPAPPITVLYQQAPTPGDCRPLWRAVSSGWVSGRNITEGAARAQAEAALVREAESRRAMRRWTGRKVVTVEMTDEGRLEGELVELRLRGRAWRCSAATQ